jgi:ABC-type transport system involved in cytochrome c biogenesis ATPase subunit
VWAERFWQNDIAACRHGLLEPERGGVEWGGRPTRAQRDAWSASFSYLAHSDGLKPELTARENLAFEIGLRRDVRQAELDQALAG